MIFLLKEFGFNPKQMLLSFRGLATYLSSYKQLKKQLSAQDEFAITSFSPHLADRFDDAGTIPQHYFFQDLFVAKKIYERNPKKHIDIGSRIDGFVAHLAVFREVEVFDIRTLPDTIPNVTFQKVDFTADVSAFEDYCDSISSLHALEHFGLGRYGDPVDVEGHLRGIENITKILKNSGIFYCAVPIGNQRIEFNAHRVFSVKYLLSLFGESYELVSFSFIDDKNNLHENVALKKEDIENNFNCSYGCGIFELQKK